MKNLSQNDFASAFCGPGEVLHQAVAKLVDRLDFGLIEPTPSQKDSILLGILKKISEDAQVVGAPYRTEEWDKGWGENLDLFRGDQTLPSLVPRFVREGRPVRWQGKFYFPSSPNFEANFIKILRLHILSIFQAADIFEIHEFGAGTGWNLVDLWEFYSSNALGSGQKLQKQNILRVDSAYVEGDGERSLRLVGSDFVQNSVTLMQELAKAHKIPLEARLFDMRSPDYGYKFYEPTKTGVLTFGAMEQLAGETDEMLDFLISAGVRIVVSVEPDAELYDKEHLEDFTAYWFQTKRGYSAGLSSKLRDLGALSKIRVHEVRRIGFGSTMMEGYNLFVWSPI